MKKNFFLFILCLSSLLVGLINGCKKDASIKAPNPSKSFKEEFETFYKLQEKGWVTKDFSSPNGVAHAEWTQGYTYTKAGPQGFPAYSYAATEDEFVYSYASAPGFPYPYSISSWLITPVISVKNGDKISFYTRGDTDTTAITDRMQVLMNKSTSAEIGNAFDSVGGFTTILLDINSTQAVGGYPTTWTKYEYTFSGISGKIDTRIAFRHYVLNTSSARGIGIDLFKFEAN